MVRARAADRDAVGGAGLRRRCRAGSVDISRSNLQIAVGIAVVVAVLARAWHPGVVADGRRRSIVRAGAGLGSGVLTTTISANGPPLALWLDAEGDRGRELRDTLQVLFAAFNLAGIAALAVHELPVAHAGDDRAAAAGARRRD